MPLERIQSMSERLKELIGYSGANAVEHPWYTGPVYTLPYQGGAEGSTAGEGVQF